MRIFGSKDLSVSQKRKRIKLNCRCEDGGLVGYLLHARIVAIATQIIQMCSIAYLGERENPNTLQVSDLVPHSQMSNEGIKTIGIKGAFDLCLKLDGSQSQKGKLNAAGIQRDSTKGIHS